MLGYILIYIIQAAASQNIPGPLAVWPEVNETEKIRDGLNAHNLYRSWHATADLILGNFDIFKEIIDWTFLSKFN